MGKTWHQGPGARADYGGYSMTTVITMQDGTEMTLDEHLGSDHRKGTRGFTDAFLERMHTQLHDHKHEAPEHAHADLIPEQRQPEA
jgi:hypothetical protein